MLALAIAAFFGGAIQSITGFGAGIMIIVVLSNFVSVVEASAINTSICIVLSLMLAFRFRKFLTLRKAALPGLVYVFISGQVVIFSKDMDMSFLARSLGVFLLMISIYFLLFEKKIHIRPTVATALSCGAVSGIFSGLFGIGGPPLGLYMINVTEDHREYIANLQFCFSLVCISNMVIRLVRGIYTVEMLPMTAVGLVTMFLGVFTGSRILRALDKEKTKKIIYVFVGISGVVTLLQNL